MNNLMTRNRSFFQLTVLLVTALSAVGSAASSRIGVADKKRSVAGGSVVVLMIPQTELKKDYPPSRIGTVFTSAVLMTGVGVLSAGIAGGIGGGVDGAVNAARAKKAEQEVLPLLKLVTNYDFDGKLRGAIEDDLRANPWLSPSSVSITKDPRAEIMANNATSSQLNIDTAYFVSQDFSSINVRATAELHAKYSPPAAKRNDPSWKSNKAVKARLPLYRNMVVYTAKLSSMESQSDQQRMEVWRSNLERVNIRRLLDQGADLVAKYLAYDLGMSAKDVRRQIKDKSLTNYFNPNVRGNRPVVLGKYIEKSDQYQIIRFRDGSLWIEVRL